MKQLSQPGMLLALVLLVCACGDSGTSETNTGGDDGNSENRAVTPPPGAPHYVLILIDTLRRDHLGIYGYPHETAPYLSELAQRGVLFQQARSTSSWTAPSTASLFTGLYPNRHGITRGFQGNKRQAKERGEQEITLSTLPSSLPTLPEMMQEAGYATFGAASNVNIGDVLGFSRGFDTFHHQHKDPAEKIAANVRLWNQQRDATRPYFMYLHFNDVHGPYIGYEPWYEPQSDELADTIAKYNSQIRYLDEQLRKMGEELNWDQNTFLMVVSDHGEEFMEHGQIGHKFTLYRELNDIVMLAATPGIQNAPRKVEEKVSLIDVLPTYLEAAGLDLDVRRDGVSLLPLIRGTNLNLRDTLDQRTVFAHRHHGTNEEFLMAAMRGSWKLIRHDQGDDQLFNLEQDPTEKSNLASEREDVVTALAEELKRFQRLRPIAEDQEVEVSIDEDLLEHLQALGYTGDEDELPNDTSENKRDDE